MKHRINTSQVSFQINTSSVKVHFMSDGIIRVFGTFKSVAIVTKKKFVAKKNLPYVENLRHSLMCAQPRSTFLKSNLSCAYSEEGINCTINKKDSVLTVAINIAIALK